MKKYNLILSVIVSLLITSTTATGMFKRCALVFATKSLFTQTQKVKKNDLSKLTMQHLESIYKITSTEKFRKVFAEKKYKHVAKKLLDQEFIRCSKQIIFPSDLMYANYETLFSCKEYKFGKNKSLKKVPEIFLQPHVEDESRLLTNDDSLDDPMKMIDTTASVRDNGLCYKDCPKDCDYCPIGI